MAIEWSKVKAVKIPEGDCKRVAINGTIVWEKSGLPSEYQRVEYIESTGTQYIDTTIHPVLSDGLFAKFQFISGNLSNYRPFGAYSPGVAIDSTGGLRIWTQSTSTINPANKITDGNVHTIQCSEDGTWDYDGETVLIAKPIQNQAKRTITLFKANYTNGVMYGEGTSRMYDFQYFRNGEVICSLVPCYRKSDGEIGMYDLVNGVFYTNSGSGTFIKGEDV